MVAFLDDDSIAAPDWLATLLRHIVTPGVVGVGCYSDGLWEDPCPSWFPGEFSWTIGVSYSGLPKAPTAVRNVWTSAMLVKRSAFEVVDGFREDFGKIGNKSLPEDTDLCLRIAAVQENAVWMWDPGEGDEAPRPGRAGDLRLPDEPVLPPGLGQGRDGAHGRVRREHVT